MVLYVVGFFKGLMQHAGTVGSPSPQVSRLCSTTPRVSCLSLHWRDQTSSLGILYMCNLNLMKNCIVWSKHIAFFSRKRAFLMFFHELHFYSLQVSLHLFLLKAEVADFLSLPIFLEFLSWFICLCLLCAPCSLPEQRREGDQECSLGCCTASSPSISVH